MMKSEQIRNNVLLDDLDKKIVNHLLFHGRDSYREIAKQLHVSTATIMHRMKSLASVVKKVGIHLDYDALGFDVSVIINIQIAKGRLFDVEKKIATHENVQAVYDVTGDYDAVILARFKNTKQMDKFLKQIQTYDFVERTMTQIILNTMKEESLRV